MKTLLYGIIGGVIVIAISILIIGHDAPTKSAKIPTRSEIIEKQFNHWDGSHRKLTEYIKDHMNDPDSYKHEETGYREAGDYLIVETKFRGKNAVGGVVRNAVRAKVSMDGEIISVMNF